MSLIYDERLKTAYDKSNEIVEKIHVFPDKMIEAFDIVNVVKNDYCPSIEISETSFEQMTIEKPHGAMTLFIFDEERRLTGAKIILNSDVNAKFKRFALIHELGHLVTMNSGVPDIIKSDEYIVSTNIDYDTRTISKSEIAEDPFLLQEQIANIFALRVLMPNSQFYRKMIELNNVNKAAEFFALTDDAIISRMRIGA